MLKTRLTGLMFLLFAVGAIAAAPLNPVASNAGLQEQENEQEQEEQGDQEEEVKYTTKEVMKLAHKDGLLKKVATNEANDEEKKRLVELYKAMAKNAPEKGEAEEWQSRNKILIEAAEAAVKGQEDAADRLLKASNCKACHDVFK